MMRIEMQLNLGSGEFPDHPYREGETHVVPDDFGAKLVARGFAVELPEEIKALPKGTVKAVPPAVKISAGDKKSSKPKTISDKES